MGLFLRQDEQRSQLQSKVATELQEKMRRAQLEDLPTDTPPRLLENQHQTRPAGIIIGILLIFLVVGTVWFLAVRASQ